MADDEGLAGARRPVEQHAALEVLTCGHQGLPLLTDPDHVPDDPVQLTLGADLSATAGRRASTSRV
jgi:hypothetical protein